jgi:lipoyl-dependent peroxiredoxin
VPRIERSSHVTWEGNVARGVGTISGDTGAFDALPFSLATRIGRAEGKTSPEELLAAAHGGCITMSIASELAQAGTPAGRLDVACRIVMDEVEGQGHQIVESHVAATVAADGVDDAALQTLLQKADESCPLSQVLRRAGVELYVSARLA